MIPLEVRLTDFINENNYLSLQNAFSGFCERNSGTPPHISEAYTHDFSINFRTHDEGNDIYRNIYFKEFLEESISTLIDRILNNLEKKALSLEIIRGDELERFVSVRIKKLDLATSAIMDNDLLFDDIKFLLVDKIEDLIFFLNSQEFERGILLDKRIKINWPRIDFLSLLILLRNNGDIDKGPSITELGIAVDYTFAYKNEKINKYENYRNSGKTLNNINSSNASIKMSLERLKALFLDKDFFNNI